LIKTRVFADTSWWIATVDRADASRERVAVLTAQIQPRAIITSEMVLVELLNHFCGAGGHWRRVAIMAVSAIRDTCQVIPQSGRLFDEALAVYGSRMDKGWSLTDCASMAIMTRYGITDALTHDHHFEQAGFRALLRQGPEND
jgi:predicted nucleic acid-binding protein